MEAPQQAHGMRHRLRVKCSAGEDTLAETRNLTVFVERLQAATHRLRDLQPDRVRTDVNRGKCGHAKSGREYQLVSGMHQRDRAKGDIPACYNRNMMSSAPVTNADSKVGIGDGFPRGSVSVVWLGAIVALGAALRLVAPGNKSFWLDEIASVVITRLPNQAFWAMLWHHEGNMALYYLLLRPWLHFGVSEANVRLHSAIVGIASIPLMYALGRHLFGENPARLAALFFAINACAIAVSQEARGYSLLVLGVVASTYLFVRLIERPTFLIACAYGVVTGLTLYCHYFGMLVPAAQAISLTALPKGRPWKQLAVAASIIGLAAVPVLWMIHIQDIGHISWVEGPSLLEVYHLGAYLAAGSGKAVGAVLLLLDLGLLALFLRRLKSLWPEREHDMRCWRHVLIASCLFFPIVVA